MSGKDHGPRRGTEAADDERIVGLFWSRDERALDETASRYGALCRSAALSLLRDPQDAEEVVNDTWLRLWNSIPPARPERLGAYAVRVVRNLCLDRLRRARAERRVPPEATVPLEELAECLPDTAPGSSPLGEDEGDRMAALGAIISRFLRTESEDSRKLFVARYFWGQSIADLCTRFGMGESRVKSRLARTRERLRIYLEKEGIRV